MELYINDTTLTDYNLYSRFVAHFRSRNLNSRQNLMIDPKTKTSLGDEKYRNQPQYHCASPRLRLEKYNYLY